MVTREVLTSHVSRLSSALRTKETTSLAPESTRWPTIEMYDPNLVHPFTFQGADRAGLECNHMLWVVENSPGANTTEMHASIDQRTSVGARLLIGIAVAAAATAVCGVGHGFYCQNLLEVCASGIGGFGLAAFAGERASDLNSSLEYAKKSDHEQLKAWESAIESGKPGAPLFEMASTGNGTWDAWAHLDAMPVVAEAAPRFMTQGVPELAAGIKASALIQELPNALVMGGTRIRKRPS